MGGLNDYRRGFGSVLAYAGDGPFGCRRGTRPVTKAINQRKQVSIQEDLARPSITATLLARHRLTNRADFNPVLGHGAGPTRPESCHHRGPLARLRLDVEFGGESGDGTETRARTAGGL